MGTTVDETDSANVEASLTPAFDPAQPQHQRSLRSKLVLSLAVIFVVFLLIDDFVRRRVIAPEFTALEQAGAVRDAGRVQAAIQSEIRHLCDLGNLWAALIHDDSAVEAVSRLPIAANEAPDLAQRKTEPAVWVAQRGPGDGWSWLHSGGLHSGDAVSTAKRAAAEIHFDSLITSGTIACSAVSEEGPCCGLTRIDDTLLAMYSVRPLEALLTSSSDGDPPLLIVLRPLDEPFLKTMHEQTQVVFSLEPAKDLLEPGDSTQRDPQLNPSRPVVTLPLNGPSGDPAVDICIEVPQEITARSLNTSKLARNFFIMGSVAAMVILLVTLQRIVIGPLASIREHSNRVAEEGFSAEPLLLTRNDEIGELANAFDQMVHKLHHAQTQLEQASEASGRSQVASTVIHNVGNVLTNVNSLLDAVNASVEGLRIGPLDILADRLRRDPGNELLLAATPDYLEGLAGSLKSDQQSMKQLLVKLHDNVGHIHDVIRDQQKHADPNIKPTSIRIQEIVAEAIAFCEASLEGDQVSVETAGLSSATVLSDRSLLLQTMINIINNAGHAMRGNEDRPRVLRIEARYRGGTVLVSFRDNGCGMASDTLQRVFDAHFTTRQSGTGLGLHFCALTLKRLGGSIRACSDGPGKGANFILELPRLEMDLSTQGSAFSSVSSNPCLIVS